MSLFISLSPQEVRQVDMKTLLASTGVSGVNGFLNLRTSFVGLPSDLWLESGSVDQSMTYVFETPPRQETVSQGKFLPFWNTAGDTDTMLTLWNYSDNDEDLVLTFFHHLGQYKLPIHLAVRRQRKWE